VLATVGFEAHPKAKWLQTCYSGDAGGLLISYRRADRRPQSWGLSLGTLRGRIIAPLEYRVSVAQKRLRPGHNEVVARIRKMDNDRNTSNLELVVLCEEGDVRVKDKVFETDQIGQIERTAREVEGVSRVDLDELAPPVPT
jgi:hypothetical protein